MNKLWGGRFKEQTAKAVEEFTSSLAVDSRLWEADLAGSMAHARMLGKCGILDARDSHQIIAGLEDVRSEIASGKVQFRPDAEDIHSEIERLLSEKIGLVAGKLHTARSRNDQVATATRYYLKDQIDQLQKEVRALQLWLVNAAEIYRETLLPGLTHFQHAQPVSFSHHLLAYFWMLQRDYERLSDCRKRTSFLPLGSAALAGTPFLIDREMTRKELGFDSVTENSLDAVSDRDFVIEFLAAASLMMLHLSRFAEELVLWSSPEFGFVELDDSVTTGSSIMPQKKNPDVAELIRGKTGRVAGALTGAQMMLKALPLSYNRDLQEDKTFLFEGLDTVRSSIRLMGLMLETAKFNSLKMSEAMRGDFSTATDLADYLVRKGLTFRAAHEIVGKIVRSCICSGTTLEGLSLSELREFSLLIESDAMTVLSPQASVRARVSEGGTGPDSVDRQINRARELIPEG